MATGEVAAPVEVHTSMHGLHQPRRIGLVQLDPPNPTPLPTGMASNQHAPLHRCKRPPPRRRGPTAVPAVSSCTPGEPGRRSLRVGHEPLLGLMIECGSHQQLGPATLCADHRANTKSSTKHANARLCATFLKHSTVQYVEMTLLPHTTAQGMPLKRHKIAMTPLSTAGAWLLLFLTRGHSWQLLPPAVARRVVCGRRVVSVPIPKHVVLRVAAFRQHALHSCARVAFHL